jgi:hypothetical protein
MKQHVLLSTVFALALASPALAASTGSTNSAGSSSNNASAQQGSVAPRIAQKLHDDLTKAGFSDVHVMPESFLVRAKDSGGNPVMMVVNPDSVTAVTALGGPTGDQSGSSGGSSATTSGAASNHSSGAGETNSR